MLIDSLSRIRDYADRIPHLDAAINCMEANLTQFQPKVFFDGGFILFQQGTTRPAEDGEFEAHRKYLDVQVVLEGSETVIWADTATLTESVPYDDQKDKVMFTGNGAAMEMKGGMFYVAYPTDAHKACRHIATPVGYRKAVIKVEL